MTKTNKQPHLGPGHTAAGFSIMIGRRSQRTRLQKPAARSHYILCFSLKRTRCSCSLYLKVLCVPFCLTFVSLPVTLSFAFAVPRFLCLSPSPTRHRCLHQVRYCSLSLSGSGPRSLGLAVSHSLSLAVSHSLRTLARCLSLFLTRSRSLFVTGSRSLFVTGSRSLFLTRSHSLFLTRSRKLFLSRRGPCSLFVAVSHSLSLAVCHWPSLAVCHSSRAWQKRRGSTKSLVPLASDVTRSRSLFVSRSRYSSVCVSLSLSLSPLSLSLSLSLLTYPFKTYPVGPSTMWTYRWSSRQRQLSACVVGQMIYGAIPRELSASFSPRTFQRSLTCKSSRS